MIRNQQFNEPVRMGQKTKKFAVKREKEFEPGSNLCPSPKKYVPF